MCVGRRPSRRLVVTVAAVILVAAAGLVLWLVLSPEDPEGADRSADAAEVAAALDRLATDPESLVAAQAGPDAASAARSAVPEGTEVTPDRDTWQPDGAGGGLMQVRLEPPGGEPVTYLAVMVHEEAGWKVLATLTVEETPAAEPTA